MKKMLRQFDNGPAVKKRSSFALVFLFFLAFPVISSCAGYGALSAPEMAWDRQFQQEVGWTGADGVQSVAMGNGRILWLFGDTWIGSILNGRHMPGSELIHNSAAIQTGFHEKKTDPASTRMDFIWGRSAKTGKPSAWIKPTPVKAADDVLSVDEQSDLNDWYWPTGDGIVLPDTDGQNRLILFLARISRRSGDYGVWGFQGSGGSIVMVPNYPLPPNEWRIVTVDNPHAIGLAQAETDRSQFETSWGMALIAEDQTKNGDNHWLYIYGLRENSSVDKEMILARSPMTMPEQYDKWEFYAGNDRWSPDLTHAVSLADSMVNEFSIDRLTIHDREVFVLIYSDNAFRNQILLRTADHPEGPWSRPIVIFNAEEAGKCPGCFAYAAKSHAFLSREGELLVSYVINSTDFEVMVNDADIYRPRFIRVFLERIIPVP
jgi:hypothetical protein